MKERLIELLGNGISPAIAASAVGCSESYVSQLLSDEAIAARISALRFENLQAASSRDKKMDSLEDKLLDKLETVVPMMMRPAEILKAVATVNAMKRRGSSAPEAMHVHNQVINLQLSPRVAIHFQLSSSKEIVEVAGRTLATMTSPQLLLEAKNHATNKLPRESDSRAENTETA